MKNIGFIPNLNRDKELIVTRELVDFVKSKGCNAYIEKEILESDSFKVDNICNAIAVDDIFSVSDFIVVLGGDGTILNVAKKSSMHNLPLIGINLGNLGYLSDVEKSEAKNSLEKVIMGEYKLEKRMMLETHIKLEDGTEQFLSVALNDTCIIKSSRSKLIELNIYVNDEYIDKYRADGVIVSTPTGSTAYNLSAGGPILKPDAEMIAITQICPHTLYARPFVVSSDDVITIKPHYTSYGHTVISMDGQDIIGVNNDNEIIIRKSKFYTTIIKTNNLGFYDILRLKMVGEMRK